jgi:hypothetical protein
MKELRMENGIRAAQKLKEGLAHHDYFGAKSDDSAIYISAGATLYELPWGAEGEKDRGQFSLGDLRDLLSFFIEQGYV